MAFIIKMHEKEIVRTKLLNMGFDKDSLDKTMLYLDSCFGKTIRVVADKHHFIDKNGAMISPVCFELDTIRKEN